MLILYREKTIDIQKIAHDHSTTSYGADKPKIVQYNTIFTTLLWFLDSIWALLDQKSRVFSVPMYEVVRCFMFRVVRWKASCCTHLSWNFWNFNCLESTFARPVCKENGDEACGGPMVELLAGNEDRKITFFDRNSTCEILGKMCVCVFERFYVPKWLYL